MAKLAAASTIYLSAAIFLSLTAPALAQEAETPFDKYIRQAQSSFDSGKYMMAEKTWRKALALAKKQGDNAKTVTAMIGVGKSLVKEEKFTLAQDMYQQALDVDKEAGLDAAPVNAQIAELGASYKTIDWTKGGADVTRFLTDCGTQAAYAVRPGTGATVHIVGTLSKKWTKSTDDLYKEYGPPSKKGGTTSDGTASTAAATAADGKTSWSSASDGTATGDAAGKDGAANKDGSASKDNPSAKDVSAGKDDNQVKQIKLDKKIEFDIVRESQSNYRVANIKGISANVGLWVKLADMLIAVDEQNNSYAQVKAGTMGVSKTVKVKLPVDAYKQLKDGIDQIDPFLTASSKPEAVPAAADSIPEIGINKKSP